MIWRASVLATALLFAMGCTNDSPIDDGADCTAGSVGCACDADGSCDEGLTCFKGTCAVEAPILVDTESEDETDSDPINETDTESETESDSDPVEDPACADDPCDANATCDDTGPVLTCSCNDGWEGDGSTCTDIDECTRGTYDCAVGFGCENTPGAWVCNDLDECALGIHNCAAGYQCENIVGTWSCLDIDECALGTDDCNAGFTCQNTTGSFSCNDIDECALGTDDCNAGFTCQNTTGSFSCNDIDECVLGTDDCTTGFTCQNTIGAFNCNDVDECALGTDDCAANLICENTVGGWNCIQMPCQSNDDCLSGDYCVFDAGANCGLTGTGLCEPVNPICPGVYEPVCDCNGITRASACFAGMETPPNGAASVDYLGECLSDICAATGVAWDPGACGHYVCGDAPPACGDPQGGCNCGPYSVWNDTSNSCEIDTDVCTMPSCDDLSGVPFDGCLTDTDTDNDIVIPLGVGVISGNCRTIFGCEVPPGYALFESTYDCVLECQGCQTNGDCPVDYYCDFPPASTCGATGDGKCEPVNSGCPLMWEPVCDCNDVTRASVCNSGQNTAAEAASVQYESICLWEQEAMCTSSGGTWNPSSCGHYTCGVEPGPCADPTGGCDCGAGSNYSEASMGCAPDPASCP